MINIHSMTDLITNSSTTIYTYSDESPNACKEMVNEIFKTFNITLKCDDVFDLVVLLDSEYRYTYWLNRNGDDFEGDLEDLIKRIKCGKEEKPKWMFDAEENSDAGGTTLHLIPKKKEYEKLAKLITNFLYSTRAEESSE
jgi:hypothetical protein